MRASKTVVLRTVPLSTVAEVRSVTTEELQKLRRLAELHLRPQDVLGAARRAAALRALREAAFHRGKARGLEAALAAPPNEARCGPDAWRGWLRTGRHTCFAT